jgi:hypothetical protein
MKRRWQVLGAAVAPLTMIAAVCGDTTVETTGNNGDQTNGISVAGQGKVTGTPDLAIVTLGVSTLAPSVGEARDQSSAAMTAMLETMRANGIEEDDIQTSQFSISAEYDYRPNETILRGFRVNNTVIAKVRDIDQTGTVVDDAVDAGGDNTQIQGIAFTIDDPKELQAQARALAVEDARSRADTLADASGVGVGRPIMISESNFQVPVYDAAGRYAAEDAAQALVPPPIEAGQLEVVVDVSVTFEIS